MHHPFDAVTLQTLAHWLGTHALPLWAAGALLVGLTTLVGWRLQTRQTQQRRLAVSAGREAPHRLGTPYGHLKLGLLLWAVAGAGFATLAWHIGPGGALAQFDEALRATLHEQLPHSALVGFAAISFLGNPPTVVVLTVMVALWLLWRRQRALACGWIGAVAGNALVNKMLKHVFERARPPHDHGVVAETGFSFPSGHASGTLATYGMLAYLAIRLAPSPWHLPAVTAAALLAYSAAVSRVALQVHYASDVVAGLLSGSAWLALCILALQAQQARSLAQPTPAAEAALSREPG